LVGLLVARYTWGQGKIGISPAISEWTEQTMVKQSWENLGISKKISTLVAVLMLFTLLTAASYHLLVGKVRDMAVEQTTAIMMQDYRDQLKNLVDAMAPVLASSIVGITDEQQVYRNFSSLIKNSRFFADNSGYYFIYKKGGTVFVLPTVPDLEGKNIIDRVDQKNNPFIRDLDQAAQGGGGFVEYWFNKPGQGIQPKLSYARMVPGTDFWVGTGVYIDDVQSRQEKILADISDTTGSFLLKLYLAIGNAFLVIVVPLVLLLSMTITKPLRVLTDVAERYSKGELNLKVPGMERRDEIGNLARAMERLGISIQKAMERLQKKG
jgi:methyl-accepting chemotaxis protein